MGIGEFIWPFDRKFSQIPCARESALVALIGGPCLGAAYYLLTSRVFPSYKVTVYGGANLLWLSFIVCHYNYRNSKKIYRNFQDDLRTGKID